MAATKSSRGWKARGGGASRRPSAVGKNVPRKEGAAKVSGTARYVDDLRFPGMLHGRTVRSTIARGDITGIEIAAPPDGLVVADHRDIPGQNVIALIVDDQPCLAAGQVRHREEPILLLAHADRDILRQVDVRVSYREAAPQLDPEQSTETFKSISIHKGEITSGFEQADLVVEGVYRTGHQEHIYIEPNGMIALPEEGGITVYGSIQCPFYVHKALVKLLGMPPERVRVIQAETGGGFGGKEEFPSVVAAHACLLALKAGRPVKIIYDREEDMVASTKRHPSRVRVRTGVKRDGTLTALDIDVLMDGGAYCTLSPVVLSRGVIHAAGPYRCDHIRIHGRTVMTNTPPNGAFRGFGAPQTQFAIEVHMDRIAEQLGMDPVEIRRKNALVPGDTTATGQVMGKDCSALAVLDAAVKRSGFHKKRKAWTGTRRGIGLSLVLHGSGFTGSGELRLAARAAVELTPRGARILVASTEIGQGTRTMHAQIVADALGLPYDAVESLDPDTSRVPDSGPTVASRTCMVVGRILQRCAEEIKERLGRLTPAEYLERHGPLVVEREYERPLDMKWDEEHYRGDAYGAYAWACNVSEVELDPDTFEVRPLAHTSIQEVGKAIHPMLAAGQVEGGVAQGIGYALTEQVVMKDGRMANGTLTNYIIPTTLDTPPIAVAFLERGYAHGPYGAKGIGELPIDGPAPAVVNALRHLGLDVREIPALPEHLMSLPQAHS